MAATEPSAEVIHATQESLSKFVKKPPLTEKLLKKPPFRFLHDIITAVLRSNGFFDGLFEESELVSENIKEREAKLIFLNKVIKVLNLTTGKTLSVKPSKIIAGQEPEKTNELLQCLGQALQQNLSTAEAVKKYKQSQIQDDKEKTKASVKSSSKATKSISNSKGDGNKNMSSDRRERNKDTNKEKTEDVNKREINVKHTPKNSTQTKRSDSKKGVEHEKLQMKHSVRNETKTNRDSSIKHTSIKKYVTPHDPSLSDVTTENHSSSLLHAELETNANVEQNSVEVPKSNENIEGVLINGNHDAELIGSEKHEMKDHTSVHPPRKHQTDENGTYSGDTKSDTEPLSNRVLKNSNIEMHTLEALNKIECQVTPQSKPFVSKEIENEPSKLPEHVPFDVTESQKNAQSSVSSGKPASSKSEPTVTPLSANTYSHMLRPSSARPLSARPGAPRIRERNEDTMVPNGHPATKVNVIVESVGSEPEEDGASLTYVEEHPQPAEGDGNRDMMHSAIGEHGHLVQQILESQKEFSQSQSGKTDIEWELGAQRARESTNQEVEQLRFALQALSKSANPLGKFIEHMQEDVDMMRQELQEWARTYEDAKAKLAKEKIETKQDLQPLEVKAKQLGEEIEAKRNKICDLKSVIHKNSARVNRLLDGGYVQ